MDRLERKFDAMFGPERYLCSVAAIGAVAAVAGSAISASSSSKASKAQAKSAKEASDGQLQATRESNKLQKEIFEQNRADSAPWRNTGEAALNELSWRMGLGGGGGQRQNALAPEKTRDAFYQELLGSGKYTTQGTSDIWGYLDPERGFQTNDPFAAGGVNSAAALARANQPGGLFHDGVWDNSEYQSVYRLKGKPGNTDFDTLNAEADRLYGDYNKSRLAQSGQGQGGDPSTRGELMRDFTMADRDADPVYQSGLQFGLQQGVQGLERQASAGGSQLSGATLKALSRYGNDYGSTKAQGAFDRFNQNKTTRYNRLAGISGTGQTAANQIAQLGQNYAGQVGANNINTANNIGSNTIGAGNARASNYIAQGQNWGNAINSLSNLYSQNNMLNQSRAGDPYKGSSNATYLN